MAVLAFPGAFAGTASAQTITAQQGDDILNERRALRQAAEKLQAPAPQPAARASRYAGEQGKFWELRTALDSAISKDMTEGAGFSVNGTPTFFVGKTTAQGFEGFRIVGAQPYAVFQQRIEGLLK